MVYLSTFGTERASEASRKASLGRLLATLQTRHNFHSLHILEKMRKHINIKSTNTLYPQPLLFRSFHSSAWKSRAYYCSIFGTVKTQQLTCISPTNSTAGAVDILFMCLPWLVDTTTLFPMPGKTPPRTQNEG